MGSCVMTAGEPAAPVVDTPPQADDQTRNQNADAAAPKVKTEKECMFLVVHEPGA